MIGLPHRLSLLEHVGCHTTACKHQIDAYASPCSNLPSCLMTRQTPKGHKMHMKDIRQDCLLSQSTASKASVLVPLEQGQPTRHSKGHKATGKAAFRIRNGRQPSQKTVTCFVQDSDLLCGEACGT